MDEDRLDGIGKTTAAEGAAEKTAGMAQDDAGGLKRSAPDMPRDMLRD